MMIRPSTISKLSAGVLSALMLCAGAAQAATPTPDVAAKAATKTAVTSTQHTAPNQDERALSIAQDVQKVYDNIQDFSADFTQIYHSVSLDAERSSNGHVYFKKAGKMRWDYAKPNERYLISDGDTLWIYEPEFAQYYSQPLENAQLPSALRFLMGDGKLVDDFHIALKKENKKQATLELKPKKKNAQFSKLHFVVNLEDTKIVEVSVFDALGNINTLSFQKMQYNQKLPDSGFDFVPPKGTTRVKAPAN